MQKNIVLFLTDQWRWDTLNDPDSVVKLPNLRKFSADARNFTNAYSPVPLCTPARASLFTGKWPHQTGTMDNVQGRSYYPQGCLHPDQTTYLERLRDAGYDVSYVGKWHLGDGGLLARGINNVMLSDGGDEPIGVAPPATSNDGPYLAPYFGSVGSGEHADGLRVDAAIALLRATEKTSKPFCLVISLHGPHFPHYVPKEFVDLYDDLPADYLPNNFCHQFSETGKPQAQSRSYWSCQETRDLTQADWRRTAQHYFGFCSYLDHQFGRVLDTLDELELVSDTVVAFTSDHGEMLGAHGWFDKGPFFYDEVMRIPMLIRAPGIEQNNDGKHFNSLKDLWPTLADAAGVTEMLSFDELQRSYFRSSEDFVTYCYDSYQGRQFKIRGIRNERYKYAWSPHDMAELYDLDTDPDERVNLANQPAHAAIQERLHDQIVDWMETTSDYLRFSSHHLPVGSYIDGRDRSFDPDNLIPGR